MRRYAEGEQFAYLAMKRKPALTSTLYGNIAQMKLAEGDPKAAQEILRQLPPAVRELRAISDCAVFARLRWRCRSDREHARRPGRKYFRWPAAFYFFQWRVARAHGDESAARTAFQGARDSWEKADGRRDEWYFIAVAQLDARLGRKEEAIREAQRAVELVPIELDPLFGAEMAGKLAQVYAWTGEPELAIEKLEMLAKMPCDISYGDLRFNPTWDSLRNQPRFEKIVASLKPATR